MVLPFGLYFFSMGQRDGAIVAMAALTAAGYALMALLELEGVLTGGMVTAAAVTLPNKLVMLVMVEATIVATYLTARASRRASLDAVDDELERATNQAHRDVLNDDVRRDLEHALSRGNMGRFTDEVFGSYRLGEVIGRGAMGVVYEATHVDDGSSAAVKLLKPELLGDPLVVRRFLREAKMAAAIDMPYVARVFEIGDAENSAPYIAMERLHGASLSAIVASRGKLPVDEIAKLLREIGCALDAAHAIGVVHRDIKPTNIFCAEVDGRQIWKVIDFGIAKLTATRGTLTQGLIVGTPAYMAPEQAGGQATSASDIFALGIIAYRALTGHAPFRGVAWIDTIYCVATSMPPRPSAVEGIPALFDDVLAIALAKDPADRFHSGRAFAMTFEASAAGYVSEATRVRAMAVLGKHPWCCTANDVQPGCVGAGNQR
jgi:serine/threonine protein kinase